MTTQTYQRATVTIDGEQFEAIDLRLTPDPKCDPVFASPRGQCKVDLVLRVRSRELRRSMRRLQWSVDQFRRAARNDTRARWHMAKRGPSRIECEGIARLLPGTGYRIADRFPRGRRQNLKSGRPLLRQLEGVIDP